MLLDGKDIRIQSKNAVSAEALTAFSANGMILRLLHYTVPANEMILRLLRVQRFCDSCILTSEVL